jgi:hypothetical protein
MGAAFSVRPDGNGSFAVELDGRDISKNVTDVDIHVDARGMPTVELSITAFELDFEVEGARIVLTPGTDDLLKQLGWTPPAEETP